MREQAIDLWPGTTGGPTLTLYPTPRPQPRGGVMVCPGGGYGVLAEHEGEPVAGRLNDAGFDAAVLRYRLAPEHRHPAMIHDAQRGLRMMRRDPSLRAQSIAVLGFSAGGHLASTLAVHHGRWTCPDDGLAEEFSARPDAAVLCYPVIDLLDPVSAHTGSRTQLLGPDADEASVTLLSTHRHVTADTPPTFLWHTAEDPAVVCDNSLCYAAACRAAGVPVELHVYERGPHGIGLAEDDPDARRWFDACTAFLGRHLAAASSADVSQAP